MRKIIFTILALHVSIYTSFACCIAEPHSLTELLLYDQNNRTIFLCRIFNTAADLHGGFFSQAMVNEVFKGKIDSSSVVIQTGGNTSAGGQRMKSSSEWLIFSQMQRGNEFSATVCDLFSCNSAETPEQFYNTLQTISAYKKMTENAYSGAVIWYFPNGTIAAEGSFLAGKPEGQWKHFRPNGTLKSESHYKNGLLHGEATEILEDNRRAVCTYNNGVLSAKKTICEKCHNNPLSETRVLEAKEGIQLVQIKSWHLNGTLASEYFRETAIFPNYSWYNYHGFEAWYLQKDSTGSVLNHGQYSRGAKIGKWTETNQKTNETTEVQYPEPVLPTFDFVRFHENGELELTGNLKNGRPEGAWKFYSQKGSLVWEVNFEDGKLSGEARKFHFSSDKVSERCQYKNGKEHGKHLSFFDDGSIQSQCSYQNGVKEGEEINYLPSGAWQRKAHFQDGKLYGEYIGLGLQGDTLLVATFKNGALHGDAIEYWKGSKGTKGCQKSMGKYENGFKTGEWSTFDCLGKLNKKCVFEGEDSLHSYYGSLYKGKFRSVD